MVIFYPPTPVLRVLHGGVVPTFRNELALPLAAMPACVSASVQPKECNKSPRAVYIQSLLEMQAPKCYYKTVFSIREWAGALNAFAVHT